MKAIGRYKNNFLIFGFIFDPDYAFIITFFHERAPSTSLLPQGFFKFVFWVNLKVMSEHI